MSNTVAKRSLLWSRSSKQNRVVHSNQRQVRLNYSLRAVWRHNYIHNSCTTIVSNFSVPVRDLKCTPNPPAHTRTCDVRCPRECEVSQWSAWSECLPLRCRRHNEQEYGISLYIYCILLQVLAFARSRLGGKSAKILLNHKGRLLYNTVLLIVGLGP